MVNSIIYEKYTWNVYKCLKFLNIIEKEITIECILCIVNIIMYCIRYNVYKMQITLYNCILHDMHDYIACNIINYTLSGI